MIDVFSNEVSQMLESQRPDWELWDWFIQKRFSNKLFCVFCDNSNVYVIEDGKRLKCPKCNRKFSLLGGSIFENSKWSMMKWVAAMSVFSAFPNISSAQFARELECTQTTAWKNLRRLKKAHIKGSQFNLLKA